MKLDKTAVYTRKSNILYKDDVAIVKFHSTFIDLEEMTEQMVSYMERFIEMNPEWCEILYDGHIIIVDDPLESVDPSKVKKYIENTVLPRQSKSLARDIFLAHNVPVVRLDEDQEIGDEPLKGTISIEDPIVETHLDEESHDPNSSRLDQVRFWIEKGLTTSSSIAEKIGGHPSYVSRLIKQVKDEK
jgi:hypothetical protein